MGKIFLMACCFTLSACAWKRIYAPKESLSVNAPVHWAAADSAANRQISTGWLSEFSDASMKSVVKEALAHNQDLQAAASRLKAAKENPIIARAARYPSVNAGVGASSHVGDENSQNYSLDLAASWEPDLWGKLRDLHSATEADYDAAVADLRGAKLSLAAVTAKAYCNLIAAQQQRALAMVTISSFEKNLRIIERNYKAGVPGVRALDVQLGRTNVSSAQRAVKSRDQDVGDAARNLEVLLGRYPSGKFSAKESLPSLPSGVQAGMPARLLERRPDLSSARAKIYASAKRADAAKKDLLPSITLRGTSGTGNSAFSQLWQSGNLVNIISGNLRQNIFNAGANEAEARAALARNDAALHDYAQLSLEAFREVESALSAEQSLSAQENFLRKELEQSALAEKQAERDYGEGIEGADILSVLESQRRANNARSTLIRVMNDRLQNRINLHLALGGSYE